MKGTHFGSIALLFAPAMAGVFFKRDVAEVKNPSVANSVPAEAKAVFVDDSVQNLLYTPAASRRDSVIPDNIFVVQCTGAGFRPDCLVFGAPPGSCGMLCSTAYYSMNIS